MWFFNVILNREHIIMLNAVSECFNSHFRSEGISFSMLILPNKIMNIPCQTDTNFSVCFWILTVFIE